MTPLVRLVLLLASACLLASCSAMSSLPGLGPGSMDLTVSGVELDDVVSLYLIVGDEADLADLDDPRTIEKVVRPERQNKYVTFGQYKPHKADTTWTLEQRTLNPTHKQVTVELSKKQPKLAIEIERKLLESRPNLAAAVVVNCGNKGWGASQKIASAEIQNTGALTLEIRSTAVSRVGTKAK